MTDGQLLQDTVRIWRIDPGGVELILVAAMEGPLFFYHTFRSILVPFRGGARFAFRDEHVYFTHPSGEASFLSEMPIPPADSPSGRQVTSPYPHPRRPPWQARRARSRFWG